MKKFILFVLIIFVVGCSQNSSVLQKTKGEKALYFIGTSKLALELKSDDNFQTAVLSDGDGNKYHLLIVPSMKRGLYMKNSSGTSIHVKGERATVRLKNEDPVEVVTLFM